MSLDGSKITDVRAYILSAGIVRDGECVRETRRAVIKWHSGWSGRLHQVYVNGRYAGTTVECEQRMLVVAVPGELLTAVRIEVFAVEMDSCQRDFSGQLDSAVVSSGRVRLRIVRCQQLPAGAILSIYGDGGTGQIDYQSPLSSGPIYVWRAWQDKCGFGMSGFGSCDFGYDSAAAVGFGRGSFGYGQFGLDADLIEWVSEPMSSGSYQFGIRVEDSRGKKSEAVEVGPVFVNTSARPVDEVSVDSYDEDANLLVLKVG